MNPSPAISVIMAVYNGEEHLAECIDSILAQSFENFEFIVVDDASTDGTRAILAAYAQGDSRVIILTNAINKERSFSRNRAMHEARAPLIAVMDADDWAHPKRLAKQYAFMQAHPEVTVCGTWFETYETGDVRRLPEDDATLKEHLIFNSSICHPTAIFRKATIMQYCGYDESMPPVEDYDLWARLSEDADIRFANIPEILLRYRTHPERERSVYNTKQASGAQVVRKHILARLGIDATEAQMDVHALLCGARCSRGLVDFIACIRWARYILQRNSVCNVYPSEPLRVQIVEHVKNTILDTIRNTAKKIVKFPLRGVYFFLVNMYWLFYNTFIKALPSKNLPSSKAVRLRVLFLRRFFAYCGTNVNIQSNVMFENISKISIGDNSGIGRDSHLSAMERITIGDNVMIGPELYILTSNHLTARHFLMIRQGGEARPVSIGDDVWIGARVTILPGVRIAHGCVIAAGAVVTKSTQPYGIYGGVPARHIKDRT